MAEWQCIGWLLIQRKLRIWLKSWLLIGREPKILPSDWSRGPSENVQRGYPYGSEPVPILSHWNILTATELNEIGEPSLYSTASSLGSANPSLTSIEASEGLAVP